jgi:two-component system chemotaxis sensor kinase CheA
MSSLLVRIDGEVFALPLDHIDEIVEISARQVFPVQGRPTIEIRKKIIALVSLADLFLWGGERRPPACDVRDLDAGAKLRVVVVQNGDTTIGLVVDHLIGMQEVVLKSLEKNYRAVPGLSGASILGDGRVSLILDVDAVIALAAAR